MLEHHAEHGEHVDGESGNPHDGEGSQQGYGNDERRNQRGPEVLEEQEHDQEHQADGFQQRGDHLLDGNFHKVGGLIRDLVGNAGRKILGQFVHLVPQQPHGFHGVGAGGHLDGHAGGGQSVAPGEEGVIVGAQFYARHVPQLDGGAVRERSQRNGFEVFRRVQFLAGHHAGVDRRVFGDRRAADVPDDDALALGSYGADDVRRRKPEGFQLFRIRPDAHGHFRPEQLHAAHALHALQFRNEAGGGKFPQLRAVQRPVGGQGNDGLNVVGGFFHEHPFPAYGFRQAGFHDFQAVLHFHGGNVRVRPLLEGDGYFHHAVGVAGGGHVQQVRRAVDFLLNDGGNGLLRNLGGGPRISGADGDDGRCDVRVLRHGQHGKGQQADQGDQQGHHPRENGTVNEKVRHGLAVSWSFPEERPLPSRSLSFRAGGTLSCW